MHIAHVRVQDMHTMHGIHVFHDCHLAHSSLFIYFIRLFIYLILHVSRAIDRPYDRTELEIRPKSEIQNTIKFRNSEIATSEIRNSEITKSKKFENPICSKFYFE